MKFWIPFVALGLLTLSCAASHAQDTVFGDAFITENTPAASYQAGPNGTAAVPGQSSHNITYTNNGAADYMLLVSWRVSLNLGGQTASASGVKGGLVKPNRVWSPDGNPLLLSANGDFAVGVYSVEAHTDLFTSGNGLKTNGNPIAKRGFAVIGGKGHPPILVEALPESLIGFTSD